MMSPELGFALFLTLLWGPTALWLAYHAVRGRRSRRSESFKVASDTVPNSSVETARPEALVAQGFWACGACHSLNRPTAKRCYSCKTVAGPTGQPAPAQQPVGGMVAVMVEAVPAKADMVPVMAEAVPMMAASVAQRPGEAARATQAQATRRTDAPVMAALAVDPTPVMIAAPPALPIGPPVCPFLGFRDDPSTRCDYPDPRNQCHATSGRGPTSSASRRQILPGGVGTKRSREIDASHQRSLCLTAGHEACPRYPADKRLVANR